MSTTTTQDRLTTWNAALSKLGAGVAEVSRAVEDAETSIATEEATRLAALVLAVYSAGEKLPDDMNGLTYRAILTDPSPHPTFGEHIAEIDTPLDTRQVRLFAWVTEPRSYVGLTCGNHTQELSFLAGVSMDDIQDAITDALIELIVTACGEVITAAEE